MITTVTTSTITMITTTVGMSAALGMVAMFTLAVFVYAHELTFGWLGDPPRFLAKAINVSIAPLVVAFIMIVILKAMEIVS